MSKRPMVLTALLVGMGLLFSACGGGSSSSSTSSDPITVTGYVKVPSGAAAAPLTAKVAVGESKLVAVTDVSLILTRVDATGAPTGDPIATVTVDPTTGQFSVEMPAGTEFSADLVLIATIGDQVLYAQVISEVVNVDPITDYIFDRLIAEGVTLGNVTPGELLSLAEFIATTYDVLLPEIDAATTLAEAVTVLESVFGDTGVLGTEMGDLITQVSQAAGSPLSGSYFMSNVSCQVRSYAGTQQYAEYGFLNFVAGTAGTGVIDPVLFTSSGYEHQVMTDQTPGFEVYLNTTYTWNTETENPTENVDATFNADGSFYIYFPVETYLEPAYQMGSQYPAYSQTFYPIGDGTYVSLMTELQYRYGLNADGTLNLSDLTGSEATLGLDGVVKQAAGSVDKAKGNSYGAIGYFHGGGESGRRELSGELVTIDFDPTLVQIDHQSSSYSLERMPVASSTEAVVRWYNDSTNGYTPLEQADPPETGIALTADASTGLLTLSNAGFTLKLQVSENGSFVLGHVAEPEATYGSTGGIFGVKLGTADPTIAPGTKYRLIWLEMILAENGGLEIVRLPGTTATYNVDGTFSVAGLESNFRKDNDFNSTVYSQSDPLVVTTSGALTWAGTNNGAFELELDPTDSMMGHGFFNADGSVGVMRTSFSTLNGASGDAGMGIALFVKQGITP